ncbi:hypothetical protein DAPPUDRAFT_239113 [Daphnia pulex]|uniref:Uncharacterized protein n=1 Tax=Daphnia pulex TaxID=6669 RepID=E9G8D3_DAPPU|nr:hypothetical protein DAPPUDRAFT_239113 [Daphnia pulex]|eukprot:EFX84293.1 hypothetical protein DAPPUDRAFT_239113 [Daphnia pulex]
MWSKASTLFLCGTLESFGPGMDILEPTLAFVHNQRSASSLSSRRNAEETSRRWTPKHLRYLQNVSEDHHLLLAEVTDVSDYLQLLWHSISGEH